MILLKIAQLPEKDQVLGSGVAMLRMRNIRLVQAQRDELYQAPAETGLGSR